jgi:CubicO group peptidase (beta-lactamase class C family)
VLERYVGHYELNGTTITVAITDDGQLTVQLTGQPVGPPLRTVSANEFAGDAAGVLVTFEGDGPKATRIRSRFAGREVVGTRIADLIEGQPDPSVGSSIVPDTPAGRQFNGWLETFNGEDPNAFEAHMRREYPGWNFPAGASRNLRDLTGGFTIVRVEASTENAITVLLKERNWEEYYARGSISVGPDGKITAAQIVNAPPPADAGPIARLTQDEALARLKTKLEEASATGHFSGAVLVTRDGEPVFDYVSGQADRSKGVANTLKTKFRIGSMNKMFTAVSILQLVQAGRIDLSAPIGTYLKDYPNKDLASRVTVEHLLTHTGGTGDFFGPEFVERRLELCEHSDYVALFGGRAVAFTPGERFAYSNYGYQLLGAIIEAVSGQSYYDYVDENIYRPAGMVESGSLPESVNVPNRSIGYTTQVPGGNGVLQPNTDTLPCRGTSAGGGYATVGDLIKFSQALADDKLLEPKMRAAAITRQIATGPSAGYGYGFAYNQINGTPAFGHGGGAPGMRAELMVFPELGYEIAIAANVDSDYVTRFAQYLGTRLPNN